MKMSYYSHANKTHFHKKGFAPSLDLNGERKWRTPRSLESSPDSSGVRRSRPLSVHAVDWVGVASNSTAHK